ncbi:MAG: BMP family ABC transporter substrate-binding protein [Actinobacteria bacterium]|nr:BMP family ABC transporter substrate-binding protein [Actinomycetota bacterium]
MAALTLSGCSSTSSSSAASSAAPAASEAAPAASEAAPASSAAPACDAEAVTKFAVVTPEKESDYGWNQQGIQGAQAAGTALGIEADVNSGVGYDNTQSILSQVADKGNQFIIAHASGFSDAAKQVADANDVPVLTMDVDQLEPGKVASVMFDAQEGGYLAGIAAADASKTGTVGIVASAEDVNWFKMSGGFIQGARSVNPDIKVVIAYIGPAGYGDSAGGQRIASQVIASGADVVFGMGDGATVGYLQAIENAPADQNVQYIATIGDVAPIDAKGVAMTSVRWNFADAFQQAIEDVNTCQYGTRNYTLSVANGGLSLQDSPKLSAETKAAVEKATADIGSGSLVVETATTKDAVQALIDK